MKLDPRRMTAFAIQEELRALDRERGAIEEEMIREGRGCEEPRKTICYIDPLSLRFKAVTVRQAALYAEKKRRAPRMQQPLSKRDFQEDFR